mmetsp:Transcript_2306/g.4907  ORF Transcript_2306/g.4907 Transcript_2306/m.4907 type:complete len:96 (+) Transcript_2306:820-1107(+)
MSSLTRIPTPPPMRPACAVSSPSSPHLPVQTPVSATPIYPIKRGGEVTYHGPGQLVVYPLLHLKRSPPYRMDLHWYLRQIEEVIVQTLKEFDVDS